MSKTDLQCLLPSQAEHEAALRIAIVRAREKGPREGIFMVGDLVIIDGIPEQLTVKEINGDDALVWVHGDESTVRSVLVEDLIDLGVLVSEAFIAMGEVQCGSPSLTTH